MLHDRFSDLCILNIELNMSNNIDNEQILDTFTEK